MATVATTNATRRPSSSVFRGSRAPNAAMVGAPTTTPAAYADTITPAWATASDCDRAQASGSSSRAMSGSSPSATNSVEPIANPPSASATSASTTTAREW